MRKNNKKGFTIVELVIVIAVIAILAAVLIPTFAGVVKNAKESAALQEANNAYKEAYTQALADGKIDSSDAAIKVADFTFNFTEGTDGKISCTVTDVPDDSDYKCVSVKNGVVSIAKTHTKASDSTECSVCGKTGITG